MFLSEYIYFTGKKGHHPSHPGYVPTLFPWQKKTTPRRSRTSSEEVVSPLKESTRKASQKKRVPLTNPEADKTRQRHLSFSEKQISTPNPEGHDYIQTKDIECPEINKYLPDIMDRIKELQEKAEMCETYKNQVLDLNEMRSNPKQIQFRTGFPNYETMYSLFVFLEPRARNLKYWRGSSTSNSEHFSKTFTSKPGPERKLSLLDEFFMTMIRLKVGLLTEDIAQRFSVSVGTVSSIVTSWVNLMYTDLKLLCELPPRDVTSDNQSKAMGQFTDVQVILVCTELFVQNPSKLDARKQLYSNYKHHITYKFLIGISPQMGVTYVSRMYGGRASDKFITTDSADLLMNLEQGKGGVMADRGFLIEGVLNDMGVKLHMPSFKGSDRPQLSAREVFSSEKISSVRIHIERAIQRIKTFHILDGELKLSMKEVAEQVFTVCAYLVNFQTAIVQC